MQRLTREQAAIIACYTGVCCGPFDDFHALAEELLDRPVMTHEFGEKAVWAELKVKAKGPFLLLCTEEKGR